MTNNNISLTIIANGHFFVAVQHGCYMIIVQMIKNVFQSSITLKKGTTTVITIYNDNIYFNVLNSW